MAVNSSSKSPAFDGEVESGQLPSWLRNFVMTSETGEVIFCGNDAFLSSSVSEKNCSSNDVSPESVSAEVSKADSSNLNNGNAAGLKKPAWNKPVPLNGVVESGSVMGGDAWPALSELTKPTSKSSADASKFSSDGSTFASQAPLMSETLHRPINSSPNANSATNHGLSRQRSMRHRGSGSSNGTSGGPMPFSYNRSPPPPPPPPPLPPSFPAMGLLPPYGTFVAPILETPPVRGGRPMGGLRPQSGSDQSSQLERSPSRRNGFGPRPRGDGQHNHNNRGRRDSHRVVPPFTPGPYIPPPSPGSASFIAPPNMRPFMTPMGYVDMTSQYIMVPSLGPEFFRGMPFIPQAPAAPASMFYPTVDMQLPSKIVKQIDYYFSDVNLERDNYLKSKMDKEGWVSIYLIANFPRVHQMTNDVQLILESLKSSAVVEVQGNKIRRRYSWSLWVPIFCPTDDLKC